MAFIEPMHRNKPNITYNIVITGLRLFVPGKPIWWCALINEIANPARLPRIWRKLWWNNSRPYIQVPRVSFYSVITLYPPNVFELYHIPCIYIYLKSTIFLKTVFKVKYCHMWWSCRWHFQISIMNKWFVWICPNSKVHRANMGPIWGRQDPGGPHVAPMNLAIWVA